MGFGGNQKENNTGMGTIGNSVISINNVWLIDRLKHNLLSISQFCDNDYEVMFNKNDWIVMNESYKSIVFKGMRKDNIYKIIFFELVDQKVLCLLSVSDENWLWHRRLGHTN